MNAIILSIGDELALGQTVDTNSAWISQQLAAVGCDIRAHMTVPDNQPFIEQAMRDAIPNCDVLIVTGGIGPTEDDLTRQSLAAVMGVELELDEKWLAHMRGFFESRGRKMPETNLIQAMIPRGATMVENTCGTAAGVRATIASLPNGKSKIENRKCDVFVTPGVPKEMKAMFTRDVLPHIAGATGGAVILSQTLHTYGLGESVIGEKLGALMHRDRNPSVGTTVSHGVVSLRLNSRFDSREIARQALAETAAACREVLGDLIYGEDEETLQQVVAKLLMPAKLTVTTAESCTGGLLAKMLTDISGSSDYFKTGFVTYSNESKHAQLGVPMELIEAHGAVSHQVVEAMAAGALTRAKADIALSISGIAGPTGGTAEKPVGTVCIALVSSNSVLSGNPEIGYSQSSSLYPSRTFNFPGDREMIRDRAAKSALSLLRFHLLGKPLPF